jgi:DNA-binding MarR family transcriptional regulator
VPTPHVPADQATAVRLSHFLERLAHSLRANLPSSSISPSMVALLARLDSDGPSPVTELSRAEGISQPSMTQLVGRAENDGLVTREQSTTDRRVVLVDLADAGRVALDERRAARSAQVQAALADLDPDDRATISDAIGALERLVDRTDRPGP